MVVFSVGGRGEEEAKGAGEEGEEGEEIKGGERREGGEADAAVHCEGAEAGGDPSSRAAERARPAEAERWWSGWRMMRREEGDGESHSAGSSGHSGGGGRVREAETGHA